MRTIPLDHLVYTVHPTIGGFQVVRLPSGWKPKDGEDVSNWLRTLRPIEKPPGWVVAKRSFEVGERWYCGVILRVEPFGLDPHKREGGYLSHVLLTPLVMEHVEVEELPLVEEAVGITDRLPKYRGLPPDTCLEAYLADCVPEVQAQGPDTAFLQSLGWANLSKVLQAAAPPSDPEAVLELESANYQLPELIARALGALPPRLRRSVSWGCGVAFNQSLSFRAGVSGEPRKQTAKMVRVGQYARWLTDRLASSREEEVLEVLQNVEIRSWDDLPTADSAPAKKAPQPEANDETASDETMKKKTEPPQTSPRESSSPSASSNRVGTPGPEAWSAQQQALRQDVRAYVDERIQNLTTLLSGTESRPEAERTVRRVVSAEDVPARGSERGSETGSPSGRLAGLWQRFRPEIYFALTLVLLVFLYARSGAPAEDAKTDTQQAEQQGAADGSDGTPEVGDGADDGAPGSAWPAGDFDGKWYDLWRSVVSRRGDAVVAAAQEMQADSIWDKASPRQNDLTPGRVEELRQGDEADPGAVLAVLLSLFEYHMAKAQKAEIQRIDLELSSDEYGEVDFDTILVELDVPMDTWPEKRSSIEKTDTELVAAVVLAMAFRQEAADVARGADGS